MKRLALTLSLLAALGSSVAGRSSVGSWQEQVPAEMNSLVNPYHGQPDAAAARAKLYRRHCASCHGKNAQGGGGKPSLRSLKVSDGALSWLLRNGSLARGMPSWSRLPEQQRWQIITYLKTLR
jgi:mono/diheme cytochrome c family protein